MNQSSARNGPNRSSSTITANLQANVLDRLWQELKAAEFLQNACVITHGLSQGSPLNGYDGKGVKLSPTVTTEIALEEHQVWALLDTGSPISIVSIEFLLKILLTATSTGLTVTSTG